MRFTQILRLGVLLLPLVVGKVNTGTSGNLNTCTSQRNCFDFTVQPTKDCGGTCQWLICMTSDFGGDCLKGTSGTISHHCPAGECSQGSSPDFHLLAEETNLRTNVTDCRAVDKGATAYFIVKDSNECVADMSPETLVSGAIAKCEQRKVSTPFVSSCTNDNDAQQVMECVWKVQAPNTDPNCDVGPFSCQAQLAFVQSPVKTTVSDEATVEWHVTPIPAAASIIDLTQSVCTLSHAGTTQDVSANCPSSGTACSATVHQVGDWDLNCVMKKGDGSTYGTECSATVTVEDGVPPECNTISGPDTATTVADNTATLTWMFSPSDKSSDIDWTTAVCTATEGSGTPVPVDASPACTEDCGSLSYSYVVTPSAWVGDAGSRNVTYTIKCSVNDTAGNMLSADDCTKPIVVSDGSSPSCGTLNAPDRATVYDPTYGYVTSDWQYVPGDNDAVDWDQTSCAVYFGDRFVLTATKDACATPSDDCRKFTATFKPSVADWATQTGSNPKLTYSVNCTVVDLSGNSAFCLDTFDVTDDSDPKCGTMTTSPTVLATGADGNIDFNVTITATDNDQIDWAQMDCNMYDKDNASVWQWTYVADACTSTGCVMVITDFHPEKWTNENNEQVFTYSIKCTMSDRSGNTLRNTARCKKTGEIKDQTSPVCGGFDLNPSTASTGVDALVNVSWEFNPGDNADLDLSLTHCKVYLEETLIIEASPSTPCAVASTNCQVFSASFLPDWAAATGTPPQLNYTVDCDATDMSSNTIHCLDNLIVTDGTAPSCGTLTVPDGVTVNSPYGEVTVEWEYVPADNDKVDWDTSSCTVAAEDTGLTVTPSACTQSSATECKKFTAVFTPTHAEWDTATGSPPKITYNVTCSIHDRSNNVKTCRSTFKVGDGSNPTCGTLSVPDGTTVESPYGKVTVEFEYTPADNDHVDWSTSSCSVNAADTAKSVTTGACATPSAGCQKFTVAFTPTSTEWSNAVLDTNDNNKPKIQYTVTCDIHDRTDLTKSCTANFKVKDGSNPQCKSITTNPSSVKTGSDGKVAFTATIGSTDNDAIDWSKLACELLDSSSNAAPTTLSKSSNVVTVAAFTPTGFGSSGTVTYTLKCVIADRTGNTLSGANRCSWPITITDGTPPVCEGINVDFSALNSDGTGKLTVTAKASDNTAIVGSQSSCTISGGATGTFSLSSSCTQTAGIWSCVFVSTNIRITSGATITCTMKDTAGNPVTCTETLSVTSRTDTAYGNEAPQGSLQSAIPSNDHCLTENPLSSQRWGWTIKLDYSVKKTGYLYMWGGCGQCLLKNGWYAARVKYTAISSDLVLVVNDAVLPGATVNGYHVYVGKDQWPTVKKGSKTQDVTSSPGQYWDVTKAAWPAATTDGTTFTIKGAGSGATNYVWIILHASAQQFAVVANDAQVDASTTPAATDAPAATDSGVAIGVGVGVGVAALAIATAGIAWAYKHHANATKFEAVFDTPVEKEEFATHRSGGAPSMALSPHGATSAEVTPSMRAQNRGIELCPNTPVPNANVE